jgi:hypothetical protein
MPLYTLRCECSAISEVHQGPHDALEVVCCEVCGKPMTRRTNRAYDMDKILVAGDTVSGGCQVGGYYDEGLGEFISGRSHRREVMKRKGLEEYSPEPETKRMVEEMRYIKAHAPKNDPVALAAAKQVGKDADKDRKRRSIKAAMAKASLD